MNISSASVYTPTLFEPKEHPSGCQCSGCCKEGNEASLPFNEDITKVKKTGEGDEQSSKQTSPTQDTSELTPSQEQQIVQLQQRDAEVRAHEAAHIAAGGAAVSGAASYSYQKGPDGKLYAVGGEVPISSSGGNSHEEKIAMARQIQAGALAPANPSPQDLKVASSAALMEAQARQEIALEKSEEQKEKEVNTYQDNQDNTQVSSSVRITA